MTYRDRPEPAPKPYTFVDLPNDRIPRNTPIGHDTFHADRVTGRLHLQLEALAPIHVASGLLRKINDQPIVREFVRVDGVPVIPGSSFKGCIRSITEAISPSCVRVTRMREVPRELQGCRSKEHLCVACQMFGAQDYMGLVRFCDLRLTDGKTEIAATPQLYRPRPDVGPYMRGRSMRGRKIYMHGAKQARGDTPTEVCAVGSRFKGILDFTNLTPAQLGLLLVALGCHDQYPLRPKLGGMKPACYGTVVVHLDRLELMAAQQRFLDWNETGNETVDPQRFLAAATDLVLAPQIAQVVEALRWPNERDCVSGVY